MNAKDKFEETKALKKVKPLNYRVYQQQLFLKIELHISLDFQILKEWEEVNMDNNNKHMEETLMQIKEDIIHIHKDLEIMIMKMNMKKKWKKKNQILMLLKFKKYLKKKILLL